MGTGLRKSHSCRDHMSIHCPPDHTVWRCYLASLAVLDILPFSSYTYSRSIRHPYGIFWNPMAHVLLLEKKQELAGLCRVGHWRTLRLALLHLHQPSLTNVASKGLELHGQFNISEASLHKLHKVICMHVQPPWSYGNDLKDGIYNGFILDSVVATSVCLL